MTRVAMPTKKYRWFAAATAIACLLIGVTIVRTTRWSGRDATDHGEGDLHFASSVVSLGNLRIRERRHITMAVYNSSDRSVRLYEPVTSCGCVAAKLSQLEIGAKSAAELSFTFVAPEKPGDVQKVIRIASPDAVGKVWSLDVVGRVVAELWATPSEVAVELDEGGEATFEIVISFDERHGPSPPTVRASADTLRIEEYPCRNGEQIVNVRVASKSSGRGVIEISRNDANGDERIVRVPVSWSPRPELRVSPTSLRLSARQLAEKRADVRFLIVVDPKKDATQVIAEPIARWVSVISDRQLSSNVVEVQVAIDTRGTLPSRGSNVDAIAFGLRGGARQEVIRCAIAE